MTTTMSSLQGLRASLRVGVAALAAVACIACPGSLKDPERFTDGGNSCPDVTLAVFPTCAVAGCHSAGSKTQGLDLETPDPASRLVGVPATEGPGLLIDPSNPANSVIYTKLGPTPPFGARMPFTRPPLDSATIACVLDWVTAQAEDGGASDGSPGTGDDGSSSGGDATTPPGDASSGSDTDTTVVD